MAKKKPKIKTRVVYRKIKDSSEDEAKKVKGEISELEERKAQTGTGVRGFLRKAAINKQIYERRQFLSAKDRLRSTKQQVELGKALVEKEKVKAELKETRKKSMVNFDDLYKGI